MAYKVLIADDEPIICIDMADILTSAGMEVVGTAADGFDAVELARQHRPDVVLMDINMPVFDGLTAAREIIGQRLARSIILITAYCDAKFIAVAKEIGAGGYLVKPISDNALVPAIEIAMAQSERLEESKKREQEALQKVRNRQLVDRAKAVLARRLKISEAEALAFMQQESMKKRRSLLLYAQGVLDAYLDDDAVSLMKQKLMNRYGLSEKAAYNRLKALSEQSGQPVCETARRLLEDEKQEKK